jgi:colanic acid biosynthesis glycosyl transferase WcaI
MRRLIFINRFFAPDHSATSRILSDLAFDLAGAGREVHLVTSRQIYDDPKAALPGRETINGVDVHRVASTGFGRTALLGRSIDYVSFYQSVRRCLNDLVRPGDIVIAKTDPPLISIVARPVARRNGARLVNWLQDIYPETAVELGVPFMRGPIAAGLAALAEPRLHRRSRSGAEVVRAAVRSLVRAGQFESGALARRAPVRSHAIYQRYTGNGGRDRRS